jgi:flavin reductase (DIM6/NTAB) family NADH-FMN oxidoreductase RutF
LIGLTANSFSSVSLDPPLVLFSLDRRAYSLRGFLSTHYFAVNILHEEQHELSYQFAKALTKTWDGVPHEFWTSGCPVITGALANFECQTRYTYHGGDHVIFVGEVMRMAWRPEGNPLLFFRGRYHRVKEHRAERHG